MATLKIDHHLINGIRSRLPSARVRADLKPINDRVINPVLNGSISVPDDVKGEVESLQAQLLRLVPSLPKGAPVAPIDIDALVTPVPAPLPQPLPQPLPSPSPAVPDPDAGRMSVFTQQSAMQFIQSAAAEAAATTPASTPAASLAADLSQQLTAAQTKVTRLTSELENAQAKLKKEEERSLRLETSLGGQRERVREVEGQRDKAKANVITLEKELATLRASQQAVGNLNTELLAAKAELNALKLQHQALMITSEAKSEELTQTSKELEELKKEHNESVRQLNTSLVEIKKELEAKMTQVAAQETRITDLLQQIETLQQALTESAKPIVSSPVLTGSPFEMIKQAITLALGSLAGQAEEINKSISEISANITAKESEAADLDLQVAARLAQMTQANGRYQARIDNLDSEFAAAADSDEGIKIARQTIAKLTNELSAAIDPANREKVNVQLTAAQKFLAKMETDLHRELRLGGREQISAEMQRDLAKRRREIDSLVARKTRAAVELDKSLAAREQARLGITPLVGQLNEIRGILKSGERRVLGLLDSLPLAVDSPSENPADDQNNS